MQLRKLSSHNFNKVTKCLRCGEERVCVCVYLCVRACVCFVPLQCYEELNVAPDQRKI